MLSRSMHTAAQHVLLGWVQTVWQPVAPCRFVCLLLMKCMYMCVCVSLKLGPHCQGGGEGWGCPGKLQCQPQAHFCGVVVVYSLPPLTCVSLRCFVRHF